MAKLYDAMIVGGGHNGLVTAAYLARAGLDVLVLERRHVLGGAAATEEVYPGFRYTVCSYVVSLLRPEIIRDLELAKYGLELIPLESTLNPLPNGDSMFRGSDPGENYREISRFSKLDAEAYGDFGMTMTRMARFVRPILGMTPPDPASFDPRQLWDLLRLGKRFQDEGTENMSLLVKLMTMSAVDWLDQWFENPHFKAFLSVSGIIGTFLGVRSPGTAYVLLHHYMGEIDGAFRSWGFARGGNGEICLSIARSAQAHGAEIRTEAPVSKILMEGDSATGVVLENGDEIKARVVASSVDPHLTFLGLLDPQQLPPEFVQEIRRFKIRGSSGKVNLALDRLPSFTCRPGFGPHHRGDIIVAPSIDYLEQAYDDAKYGRFSRRPMLDVIFPSVLDPTMAPPGKHVLSAFVQYAPYKLSEGTWPQQREAFGDAVIDTLEELAPGLKDSILHRQVLTPWDLEQEFGLTEGNIFHGELSLEQLFFLRPTSRWSRYNTPIQGLYLCGSGAHPGGGVMGAPGALAAVKILKDLGRSNPRKN